MRNLWCLNKKNTFCNFFVFYILSLCELLHLNLPTFVEIERHLFIVLYCPLQDSKGCLYSILPFYMHLVPTEVDLFIVIAKKRTTIILIQTFSSVQCVGRPVLP